MIADLEQQLASVTERISKDDGQLTHWTQYRDIGQHDNEKTICLLEQELVDMEASFTDISSMNGVSVNSFIRLTSKLYTIAKGEGSWDPPVQS